MGMRGYALEGMRWWIWIVLYYREVFLIKRKVQVISDIGNSAHNKLFSQESQNHFLQPPAVARTIFTR